MGEERGECAMSVHRDCTGCVVHAGSVQGVCDVCCECVLCAAVCAV